MSFATLNLSSRPTFTSGRALARAGLVLLVVGVLVNLAGQPAVASIFAAGALLAGAAALCLLLVAAGDQLIRLVALVVHASSMFSRILPLLTRVATRAAPLAAPPPRSALLV